MISTAIFPGRYVQGDRAFLILGEEVARQGKSKRRRRGLAEIEFF